MKGLSALQVVAEGPTLSLLALPECVISYWDKAPSLALYSEGKKLVKPVYF